MTQPDELRIGDAQRDQVIAQLEQHMVAGRLTPDEYEDRVGRALAAKTASDLRPLLADLPALPARHRWWQRPLVWIVALVSVLALGVGLRLLLPKADAPIPVPATSSFTSKTEPPNSAPEPTTTKTVTPNPSTVTVTAAPSQTTVTVSPTLPTPTTNDCPFTRPLSPAQLAQAGAECAMGHDAYCHCIP